MESIILRPTKSQAIKLVTEQAPHLLEVFRDFQASNGGWLRWPDKFLQIKKNLKLDDYVTLYEDEKRIGMSLYLFMFGKEAVLEENEKTKNFNDQEKEEYVVNLTQELMDDGVEAFESMLPNLDPTTEELEEAKGVFEKLSENERVEAIKKQCYLFLYLFSSLHNYFSIMVCGEALTSLVPKAIAGDDDAFCKAAKIDRNLIFAHPYFIDRYQKAQIDGDKDFLRRLSVNQSTPGLVGKISYPGLYVVFAMLEALRWLDDLEHSEILDICDAAGLDRWQNRIEDKNYLTKRLIGYRRYQKTSGLSMHSN